MTALGTVTVRRHRFRWLWTVRVGDSYRSHVVTGRAWRKDTAETAAGRVKEATLDGWGRAIMLWPATGAWPSEAESNILEPWSSPQPLHVLATAQVAGDVYDPDQHEHGDACPDCQEDE